MDIQTEGVNPGTTTASRPRRNETPWDHQDTWALRSGQKQRKLPPAEGQKREARGRHHSEKR